MWPKVRPSLPPPPARVLEIGCGKQGGFVPVLLEQGYDAVGIDPVAPVGDCYRQGEFERTEIDAPVDAVVACTSLHHVANPRAVLGKIGDVLNPTGRLIVVEWDWEAFDEGTASWCFERLIGSEEETWLHRRRDDWIASGKPWEDYFWGWAEGHGLQSVRQLLRDLDRRFEPVSCERGPFFFADLSHTSEEEEMRAVSTGRIRAGRIDYVGRVSRP